MTADVVIEAQLVDTEALQTLDAFVGMIEQAWFKSG